MSSYLKTFFFIISFFCLTSASAVYAQKTKIIGKVLDAQTLEPLPFVNVLLKNTNVGTTTDFEGRFSIETTVKSDSLLASYIGYKSYKVKIKNYSFQELEILMQSNNITLEEVIIRPGENPAEILLKKVIKNKKKNNTKNIDFVEYEKYNKIEFDANNIGEKFKKRKLLKHFQFIFDYMDTSIVNGKSYLPVFLSESLSDVYKRTDPKKSLEIVKANKLSGFENKSIVNLLSFLYQKVNIYDNYINLFEKNFVSPVSNFGLLYYKYYLVDSSFRDNHWSYKVMFKPRRKQELTFTGNFWVVDTAFAVQAAEIKIANDANINFINDLDIKVNYKFYDDKYWLLSKDYVIADFNLVEGSKKVLGFYGHRTTTYRNYVFDKHRPTDFYNSPVDVITEKDSFEKEESFWENARHEKLTEKEKGIYVMVDSIKNVPIFRTYLDIIHIVLQGYYKVGKVELGPVHKTLSFNPVEGTRLRFGARTNKFFSEKFQFSAYTAYGEKDKRFKYGLSALYLWNKNPRRSIYLSHIYDVEQLGTGFNAYSEDSFLSSLLRRSPSDKLIFNNEYNGYWEYEWFTGFSNKIKFKWQNLDPVGGTIVKTVEEGKAPTILNSIVNSEIGIEFRFAYKEKFLINNFKRKSLGTKYPILTANYTYGIPNVLGSDYEYHKVQFGIRQWFNFLSLGWSRYYLEAGKVYGTLPYPLLKLPPGNQSFIYDEFAFNLMNYFEFTSDEYVSLMYTHHFDGFFLNHIPLMRKLKWREVIHAKGIIGTLSKSNLMYNDLPEGTVTLERPYFEAGVGIENIFKFFRIDAVWRLSHMDNPDASNFGVFGSVFFAF
ncbi:MAG: DUF5686 family protein [Hyphomicrobiales bacterium]